ncbi:hypothetical protein PGTUg99_005312 [Puccinia graminis f. sp. tritici]|uniref:Uncharacterized protein n=1 Tax=Puccinia graminis f. sp. tritici TaxID=56615 RepID=A0A5B0R6P3_PUCGR|nr:hypothetical protein PGTUg99_005312 [Puccinia graminis f. sp. tritici]
MGLNINFRKPLPEAAAQEYYSGNIVIRFFFCFGSFALELTSTFRRFKTLLNHSFALFLLFHFSAMRRLDEALWDGVWSLPGIPKYRICRGDAVTLRLSGSGMKLVESVTLKAGLPRRDCHDLWLKFFIGGTKRTSDLTEDFSCKDFLSTGQFFNSLLIFQDFFSTPHREGWIDGLNSKVIGMLSCFYWSFFGFLSSVHHAEPIFIDLEKTLRPPGLTQSRVNDDEIENSPYLCSIQLANESFGISFILNSSLFLFKTTDL